MDNGASFDTPRVPRGVQVSDEKNIFDFSLCAKYACIVKIKANFVLWQYELSSFQAGDIKWERCLPKNQHTQSKSLNFENWCSGELSKIGHHFKNEVIKHVNNKNVLIHCYSKYSDDF